jgi:UDP-glucose 4-epimerase
VTWRECDLAEEQSVRELLVGVRPEVVLHLAGHVSGRREPDNVRPTLIGNLVATVHVLLAALAVGSRRVVLAGSYEEPEADAAPRSPYAASKIGATAYARLFSSLYGLSTVVLRPTMIYGPGQRDTSKLIPYVTRCFLAGEAPVLGSGQRPIDWVYVDDVADAFVLAATAPKIDARVIDIGSGELHTIVEIVEMLAAETRATVAPHYGGLADRPAECVIAADPEPARRLLGWRAVTPLADGLARTVADVRARARAEGTRPGSRDQRPSGT